MAQRLMTAQEEGARRSVLVRFGTVLKRPDESMSGPCEWCPNSSKSQRVCYEGRSCDECPVYRDHN